MLLEDSFGLKSISKFSWGLEAYIKKIVWVLLTHVYWLRATGGYICGCGRPSNLVTDLAELWRDRIGFLKDYSDCFGLYKESHTRIFFLSFSLDPSWHQSVCPELSWLDNVHKQHSSLNRLGLAVPIEHVSSLHKCPLIWQVILYIYISQCRNYRISNNNKLTTIEHWNCVRRSWLKW